MIWLYLFHGNNNLASFRKMSDWCNQYKEKYTDAGLCVLDATDFNSEKDLAQNFTHALVNNSLFSSRKLLVVKRVCQVQKKGAYNWYKSILEELVKVEDDGSTVVVFWDEITLNNKNPLLKYLQERESSNQAKIYEFMAPQSNKIKAYIQSNLKMNGGGTIEDAALSYLVSSYHQYGQYLTQKNQLKSVDDLVKDERLWWLESVLESSRLLSESPEINLNTVKMAVGQLETAISPFDLAKQIQFKNKMAVKEGIRLVESQFEDDEYFGLWAAWRWYFTRNYSNYALQLLGEIELFVKNGLLEPLDATVRFVDCMMQNESIREQKSLLDLRKAWLANLPKS